MGVGGAKNIFEESRPMFFITGLAGLRPPRICKRAFPGYVYVTLILLTYHLLYWFNLNDTLDFFRARVVVTRTSGTREIQTFTNIAFVTVMIITSVRASPRIRRLYVELSVADEKLKLLNVRFDYGLSARREAVHVARVVMITIVFNLVEYFPEIGPDYDGSRDLPWILGTLPQFIDSVAVASYVIVIGKIRRRIEAVNELIPNVAILDKNAVSTLESEMNSLFRLRLLNRIHEKLLDAATALNDAYGPPLLASFVVYFLTSCAHLRTCALTYGSPIDVVDFGVELIWTIFYLGKCAYVIDACHNVTLQARLSGRLLRDKCMDADHQPLKNETDAMARRVDSRVLQLTACNFFDIDYPALKKIVVGLAVYVFFVHQFAANSPRVK